ncbi:MAG: V-type ATPase 116kDa subunit family protein [Elusimicrobiota bacterium]
MKRFFVIAHSEYRETIVSALRKTGITEIEFTSSPQIEMPLSGIEEIVSKIQEAIEVSSGYLLQQATKQKIEITGAGIEKLVSSYPLDEVHKKLQDASQRIRAAENEISASHTEIKAYSPWEKLPYLLSDFAETGHVKFFFCRADSRSFNQLKKSSAHTENLTENLFDIVWSDTQKSETIYFVVSVWKPSENSLVEKIRELNITMLNIKDTAAEMPADVISAHRQKISSNRELVKTLQKELRALAAENSTAMRLLWDYWTEAYRLKSAQSKLPHTGHTFAINGWVPSASVLAMKKVISGISNAVEIITRDPQKGESPPVLFRNKRLVSPFEFVTKLYDRPQYDEADPTPFLAPFFAVLFSLCVSDLAYGIVLATASYIALKKISPANKLLKLLFYCGIMTAVSGVLLDSFAGLSVSQRIIQFKKFVIVNPVDDPMKMLFISLGFGFVQVLFGMCIKLYIAVRNKNYGEVMDQLLWSFFFVFMAPVVFKLMFGKEIFPGSPGLMAFSGKGSLVLAVLLLLTQGRSAKIVPLMPLLGAIKLYGIVGLFADVLSYCRVFALGLVGIAVAQTVNIMAGSAVTALGGVPLLGFLLAGLIALLGHSFNIAMNCLGAFVHSARLQYLEFFGKFFTGGGREFVPFAEARQYSIIKK